MLSRWHTSYVILAIIGADLVAGGLLVVGRIVVNGKARIPPMIFTWFRYLLSTALMHFWLALKTKLAPWRQMPRWQDMWKYASYGCGHATGQVLIFLALDSVPAIVPSLFRNTIPTLVCVMSVCIGLECLNLEHASGRMKLGGILFSTAGGILYVCVNFAWVQSNRQTGDTGYNYPLGTVELSLSSLALSFCWCMQKLCLNCGKGALYTVTWGLTFGLLFLTVIVVPQLSAESFALSPEQMTYVAYAAVFPSTIGFSLQAWAMKETSPTFVIAFDPLGSIITAVLAWFTLGEMPNLSTCVSAPVIVFGLYLLLLGRKRELDSLASMQGHLTCTQDTQ